MPTIMELLKARGAYLLPGATEPGRLSRRLYLSRRIASSYAEFEPIRDGLLGRGELHLTSVAKAFLVTMEDFGVAHIESGVWRAANGEARKYLSGGWLEEYVASAVFEARADEVFCGQKIAWEAAGFRGENEVDVLARFGEKLFFCSCKALKLRLEGNDVRTRERLMDALHEADNLADHFARSDALVALAVTTDLIDEARGGVRFEPLHGKGAALGVHILSAEKLSWPVLVREVQRLFADQPHA
ncbi:DUF1887 family CARF protein [Rhizobium sp. CECT 9324]|uniref:Card1-like endonuclease domain-containing protein n=1 Tax=Rhizobium sp. CECT 9324 TaxID=2845820 RepID=UPI001E633EE3|nr:DUF1887 family CARF protein [Rhizobium sp. CECT 9324]CAH0343031.1 hypothetical protein RHI9324_04764 [Rhizobium sp. CECT 9324]